MKKVTKIDKKPTKSIKNLYDPGTLQTHTFRTPSKTIKKLSFRMFNMEFNLRY